MPEDLRSWIHQTGDRHGFGSPGGAAAAEGTGPGSSVPSAAPDAPSSDPDSQASALDEEARQLHGRASELVTELQTAVDRAEHVDYLNRLNTFFGRLRDPANEGNAAELRRVVTDLRELIADVEARLREVDGDTDTMIGDLAAGRPGAQPGPETPATPASLDTASSDEGATYEELATEGRQVFQRIRRTLEPLTGTLTENERRQWVARLNTFNGRVNAPAGDAQEMRRVVTDLYAALQDLERRARELQRNPESAQAAGGEDVGDPAATASSDPDADFRSLVAEARDVYQQAAALYEELLPLVDESEHTDLRDRLNSFNGRVRSQANARNAQEMRRVITDLHAVVDDWQSRQRELQR